MRSATSSADRYGPGHDRRPPASLADRELLARIAPTGSYGDPVLSWVFADDTRTIGQLMVLFTGMVDDMLPDRGTANPR